MSSPIFDQWILCLRAFDDLSLSDQISVSQEVGKGYFREELLVWGTQEVLPDIFSGKRSLEDGDLRGKFMKRSLTAILKHLQILKNGDQQNVSSRTSRQASYGAGRGASRLTLGIDGENAGVPSGVYDTSSRGKQKSPPNEESSSDSDSSVASDGPIDTASRGDITVALDRMFQLASFGADYILPNEDECPAFFEAPGAKAAFPRAWRLISEKFPTIEDKVRMPLAVLLSISLSTIIRNQKGFPFQPKKASHRGIQDIPKQLPYVLRRSTLASGRESKRSATRPKLAV
ncbi:hypothetical protein F4825DRAFT_451105 [Nemania diffusa]|nr:hypothetical protein F4825DRAFT_451105 [Nemania diffusa]